MQKHRFHALQAFTQFLSSTLRKQHAIEKERVEGRSAPWPGYEDPALERLRQGIGPEDVALVQVLKPTSSTMQAGHMTAEEIAELERCAWGMKPRPGRPPASL